MLYIRNFTYADTSEITIYGQWSSRVQENFIKAVNESCLKFGCVIINPSEVDSINIDFQKTVEMLKQSNPHCNFIIKDIEEDISELIKH